MKLNTESTIIQRLRLVIGALLCVVGCGILIYQTELTANWGVSAIFVGLALIVVGLLVAASTKLIDLVQGLLTWW